MNSYYIILLCLPDFVEDLRLYILLILFVNSDDSLGYEFPFRLRVVDARGAWCALCAWPALCRGCALPADDEPLVCDSRGGKNAGV